MPVLCFPQVRPDYVTPLLKPCSGSHCRVKAKIHMLASKARMVALPHLLTSLTLLHVTLFLAHSTLAAPASLLFP